MNRHSILRAVIVIGFLTSAAPVIAATEYLHLSRVPIVRQPDLATIPPLSVTSYYPRHLTLVFICRAGERGALNGCRPQIGARATPELLAYGRAVAEGFVIAPVLPNGQGTVGRKIVVPVALR